MKGGAVKSLRGQGYYYVASVAAGGEGVELCLPPGRVKAGDYANLASNRLIISSAGNEAAGHGQVSMAGEASR